MSNTSADLTKRINEFYSTEVHKLIRKLYEVQLQGLREANDNADRDQVLQNQGAITWLKSNLKLLSPTEEWRSSPIYSGGFA